MSLFATINDIKRLLTPDTWPWVLQGLRHDSTIWNSLRGKAGERLVAFNQGRSAPDFSPAALALAAVGQTERLEDLRVEPMQLIKELDGILSDETSPEINRAASLALRLRRARVEQGDWRSLAREQDPLLPTAAACLYGILSDPLEMLKALAPLEDEQHTNGPSKVLHVLLSQPLTPDDQLAMLEALLAERLAGSRVALLQELSRLRPALAAGLARLFHAPTPEVPAATTLTIEAHLYHLSRLAQAAHIHRLTRQDELAMGDYQRALTTASHLQARLFSHQAGIQATRGDHESALQIWQQAFQRDATSQDILAGYVLSLLDAGRTAEAQNRLSALSGPVGHAGILLAQARLAHLRDQIDEAREFASQSLQSLEADRESALSDGGERAATLAGLLLELNHPRAAQRAADLSCQGSPNNPDRLALLSKAHRAAGDAGKALEPIQLAAAFAPQRNDLHLALAEALESVADWDAALLERQAILEKQDSPTASDLRAVAGCALNARQPAICVETCQRLLDMGEENGLTYALLGEAQAALGDLEAAREHLQHAVQVSPQHPEPWLALARYYHKLLQPQKTLETLQAATNAAPNSPELQLALGEIHLEMGSPAQALESLRRAADIVFFPLPFSKDDESMTDPELGAQIALRLGQTLSRLGHQEEAQRVLEEAYHQTPAHPGLAQTFAQVLVDLGEMEQALVPLESLLQDEPGNAQPYVAYASCLFSLPANKQDPQLIKLAVPRLKRALELEPDNQEALAWLGEALLANDEPQEAIAVYRQALETSLAQDPGWKARLNRGMGQAALQLGQVETAVVALQDAHEIDPQDPAIQCSLSEAYDAAGLLEDALQAARGALMLAPTDVNVLTWFANQALNLGQQPGATVDDIQKEAVDALEQAIRLAPRRTDLLVRLAHTQARMGDLAAAMETYRSVAQVHTPDSLSIVADLYQAGQGLVRLGDAASAATCLEKALQSGGNGGGYRAPSILDLLRALADARKRAGNLAAALEALDQAIGLAPNQADLYIEKAQLLLETGEHPLGDESLRINQEAFACLQKALYLDPHNLDLNYKAALFQQAAGNLKDALAHAERMLAADDASHSQRLVAQTLAADLSLASLQSERAQKLLEQPVATIAEDTPASADLLPYYHLRAELALQAGDDQAALFALELAQQIAPEDPRSLAIQARLAYRQGRHDVALEAFEAAVRALAQPTSSDSPVLRGVIEAALELHQWAPADSLSEALVRLLPHEPRSFVVRARVIVLQAEFQHLCRVSNATRNAPGRRVLVPERFAQCLAALDEAARLAGIEMAKREMTGSAVDAPTQPVAPTLVIHRWRVRAQAVFNPTPQCAKALAALSAHPDDTAAQVACLSELGEINTAGIAAREYSSNPHVLLQLALALAQEKPRRALAAIRAAVDALGRPQDETLRHTIFSRQELAPFIYVFMAKLLQKSGNRITDRNSALKSIQEALKLWPDEPNWHILAAEIYLDSSQPDTSSYTDAAVAHLEQAAELAPQDATPWLHLGQIFLAGANLQKAVQAFEAAIRLNPQEYQAWLALANVYQQMGDLEKAAAHAERAVTLAPNAVRPLLLRGEIALQNNNPRGAQTRAKAALRISPTKPEALLLLSRSLKAQGQIKDALRVLDDAASITIGELSLALERVTLLQQLNGPDAAFDALNQLDEQYPGDPVVLARLAQVYMDTQQIDLAIRTAQNALRNEADLNALPQLEHARLHALLGQLLRRKGQLDQAIHHLDEALQLTPDQVDIYLELGLTYQERRAYSQALEAFHKAVDIAPDDHRPYYQLGLALKESKDYSGAERMLRKAAELAPDDLGIHRLLAAVVALNLVHNPRNPVRDSANAS